LKNLDKKSLLILLIYLAGLILFSLVNPASAIEGRIQLEETLRIDETTAGQQFRNLSNVAYDGSKDEILITDTDANRVYIFNRRGEISGVLGRGEELQFPTGVVSDGKGTIYVGEKESGVIKVFEGEAGRVSGSYRTIVLPVKEGEKKASPCGMAISSGGDLLVVDSINGWILVFDPDGEFRYRIGRGGREGKAFSFLRDIALDARGYIYAASSGIDPLKVFDQDFNYLHTVQDLLMDTEVVTDPISITVDRKKRLWVLDGAGRNLKIYDPSGHLVQTIKKDEIPGGLFLPLDIEFDVFDNLMILERGADRLRVFSLRY
jgi:sugar lactone lactonase YvrE